MFCSTTVTVCATFLVNSSVAVNLVLFFQILLLHYTILQNRESLDIRFLNT